MLSKAEQYRQAWEAAHNMTPSNLQFDGGLVEVTQEGGIRVRHLGQFDIHLDAEQTQALLRWLRDQFEPPQDVGAKTPPTTTPKPDLPELTDEDAANFWTTIYQYVDPVTGKVVVWVHRDEAALRREA